MSTNFLEQDSLQVDLAPDNVKPQRRNTRGFVRLKTVSLILCILVALIFALSVGMFVAGALILHTKLELISISITNSILIGLGAFLVAGTVLFILLYRSDKALARMLDRRFDLKERVQTMMAYRSKNEAIYELQRADAEAVVEKIPIRGVKIRFIWAYLIGLVISAFVLFVGVAYTPVEPPAPPVVEVPFEITDIQIAAMEELIEYVSTSDMDSPYREDMALTLTDLLEELKAATTVTARDVAVDKALEEMKEQTDSSSSALEIIEALWGSGSETVKPLAEALNYYVWQKGSEWDEYVAELVDVRAGYVHPDSTQAAPDIDKMTTEIAALLSSDSTAIMLALARSGIASEDQLYFAVVQLAAMDGEVKGFSALSVLASTIGYTALEGEIDALFSALTPVIYTAVEQNSVNTSTGEYAMKQICILFEHTFPIFERPVLRDTSTEAGGDGGESGGGNMGGIGTGTVYGSDDLVLDPYTDKYVEYGTILDKYYALMFGKTEDGDYNEEEIAALKKYFEILYGGFEDQ